MPANEIIDPVFLLSEKEGMERGGCIELFSEECGDVALHMV
jgi:hypothetical protein